MRVFRFVFMMVALLYAPPLLANSLLGETGFACLLNEIETKPAPETMEQHIQFGIGLQSCWTQADLITSCDGGALARCAMKAHGEIVATQYSIEVISMTLPEQKRTAYELLSGVNRPEKWANCIADHQGANDNDANIAQALVNERIAFVTCDAIFTMIDTSVVFGFYLSEREQK